jgi:basic membrane protein A
MKKLLFSVMSVLMILSFALAACQPAATPAPAEEPAAEAPAAEAPAAEEPAAEEPAAEEPAAEAPAKTWKLAAVFPGVITDADYNTLGYLAVEAVKNDMGLETAYSESVAVPDVDRAMREYVDGGFNIIWVHGGQYLNQALALAKEFPDVVFIVELDEKREGMDPNVWILDRNFHVGFYAIGAVAARASKTGKIGYIGGQTLPFSYAEVHAMQQAVKDSGLNVEIKPVWAGDFNDPAKSRQVADTMIAEGMDVLVGSLNLGMQGIFEAVKAKTDSKVLVTAKYTDKSSFAPDNYVTSLLIDLTNPLKQMVEKIMAGETGGYYQLTFETGVNIQTPLGNVDEKIGSEMETIINDVKSGKIEVVKDITEIK